MRFGGLNDPKQEKWRRKWLTGLNQSLVFPPPLPTTAATAVRATGIGVQTVRTVLTATKSAVAGAIRVAKMTVIGARSASNALTVTVRAAPIAKAAVRATVIGARTASNAGTATTGIAAKDFPIMGR